MFDPIILSDWAELASFHEKSGLALSNAQGAIEFRPQPNLSNLFKEDSHGPKLSIAQLQQQKDEIIPKIHWPNRPDWVELYNGTWDILLNNLREPALVTDEQGVSTKALPSFYIDEGYSNKSIFQWDSIFAVHTARYISRHFYLQGSLDNFYAFQHASGFINREISESNGNDILFRKDPDYPWFVLMTDRRLHSLGFHPDWMKEFYDAYSVESGQSPVVDSDNPPLFAWAEQELSQFHFNPAIPSNR